MPRWEVETNAGCSGRVVERVGEFCAPQAARGKGVARRAYARYAEFLLQRKKMTESPTNAMNAPPMLIITPAS